MIRLVLFKEKKKRINLIINLFRLVMYIHEMCPTRCLQAWPIRSSQNVIGGQSKSQRERRRCDEEEDEEEEGDDKRASF